MTTLRARPAFPVPPHVEDPSGLVVAWFTDPPGSLIQFTHPGEGSIAVAQWIAGPARRELETRFPDGPLIIIFDLGLMTRRDPECRRILLNTAKDMRHRIRETAVIPPHDVNPVFLASLKAAASVASMAGVNIRVHQTLSVTMARLGVTVATREGAR